MKLATKQSVSQRISGFATKQQLEQQTGRSRSHANGLWGATETKRLWASFDFEIIRKKAEVRVRRANTRNVCGLGKLLILCHSPFPGFG